MISVPAGVRVWLAVGRTDMRRGMNGLALQVQEALGRDPLAGDVFVFRGRAASLIKILWHDGIGMSLYAKRLGPRSLRLAIADGRAWWHLGFADDLHAGRDRLEKSASYLATAERRIVAALKCSRSWHGEHL